MAKTTTIQWCDSTVNPVMGCGGCELWVEGRETCYAGLLHERRKGNPGFAAEFLQPKLFAGRMAKAAAWGDLTGQPRPDKPWLDGLPRLIFVSDMGDALSEQGVVDHDNRPVPGGVPFTFLKAEIVDTAASARGRRHQWLWLTKRPQRLAKFCEWLRQEYGLALPPNVWVGTSVTTRATLGRLSALGQVGDVNTIRFASVEPLWEEVSLAGYLERLRWVIVGGESRQASPPVTFQCDWAKKLREECAQAGIAFFIKQLGSSVQDDGRPLRTRDSHGGDWDAWPEDLRVRQMPYYRSMACEATAS